MTPQAPEGPEPVLPNSPTPERKAIDWLLTDAFYAGRLSVREYNSRVRALWWE